MEPVPATCDVDPGLLRSRYPLPSLGARAAGASFSTWAVFDGHLACALTPRERVEALLPPELRLADAGEEPAERHPLLFVFGRQSRCGMGLGGVEVEREIGYDELAVLVPFVTHVRVGQLVTFVPGMVSSYYLSNWTGKVHYGYGKQLGRLLREPGRLAVFTAEHGLAFGAHFGEPGPWLAPDQAARTTGVAALREMAALPWVGRRPTGPFARSWSDWVFEAARVRQVGIHCTVYTPFLEGLAPGDYPALEACGLEVRGMGWRLSWPRACPF